MGDGESGMVDKIDEMAKAIVVKGKVKKEEKTLTFATDDKTKIQIAGRDVPFADLKKEMQVSVEYKKEGEKMIATMIKVAAPKAAPKKEAPKEGPKKSWAIHLKQERHTGGGCAFLFFPAFIVPHGKTEGTILPRFRID